MKKRWLLVGASLLVAGALAACIRQTTRATECSPKDAAVNGMIQHPTAQLARHYEDIDYGCLFVVPYFLDIMAIESLRQGKHREEVRNYLDWVFERLNESDRWGLTGTIFDYVICCDGSEISTKQYDSADGYAGQFLMAVEAYFRATNDRAYVNRHRKKLFEVAEVITHLQDPDDGLSIAMIGYPVKYAMDNAEAYGGLVAFVRLAKKMKWSGWDTFELAASRMRQGLMIELFDQKKNVFSWAKAGHDIEPARWNRFYPDALSQLFPILYGVVPADSEIARKLWKEFKRRYTVEDLEGVEQRILFGMARDMME
jgi:stage V sporulation protein SpoVS